MATREITTVERVSLPLYRFADTDRLAHVSRGTSKRWLSGYRYRTARGQPTAQPPVTPVFGDREAACFTDLVEIVATMRGGSPAHEGWPSRSGARDVTRKSIPPAVKLGP